MSKTICMCFIPLHYVSLYYYICVHILLYISSMSIWVSSIDKISKKKSEISKKNKRQVATLPTVSYIGVLMLLYMCPHATVCVFIVLYLFPHTTTSDSFYYLCVLILPCMCPPTTMYVSSYYYMCRHTTIYVSCTS